MVSILGTIIFFPRSYSFRVSENPIPKVFDLESPVFNNAIPIYSINGTTVQILRASILDDDSLRGNKIDAIAISAKIDLEAPYNIYSLDYLILRDRLNEPRLDKPNDTSKIKEWKKKILSKELKKIDEEIERRTTKAKEHFQNSERQDSGNKWWVPDYSFEEKGLLPVYYLAGIPALSPQEIKEGKKSLITPELLSGGVFILLNELSNKKGIKNLAVPVLGAGAGGLENNDALRSILIGINKAAERGLAPETVSIVIYPGSTWEEVKKNQEKLTDPKIWLNYQLNKRDFKSTGRFFNDLLNQKNRNDLSNRIWFVNAWNIWLWQTLLLPLGPCLAILLTIVRQNPPLRVKFGSLIEQILVWEAVLIGFKFGSEQMLDEPPAMLTFLTILLGSIVVPFWKWNQYGKPVELECEPQEIVSQNEGGMVAR